MPLYQLEAAAEREAILQTEIEDTKTRMDQMTAKLARKTTELDSIMEQYSGMESERRSHDTNAQESMRVVLKRLGSAERRLAMERLGSASQRLGKLSVAAKSDGRPHYTWDKGLEWERISNDMRTIENHIQEIERIMKEMKGSRRLTSFSAEDRAIYEGMQTQKEQYQRDKALVVNRQNQITQETRDITIESRRVLNERECEYKTFPALPLEECLDMS
ncbi:hypothetical protein KIPB_012049, partial [Kipferlia bialata]|eukprot:g12049.t1